MLGLGLGAVALGGAMLGYLAPRAFRPIYVGAMLLALPVGWVTSQIALAAMFYGVVTPLALLFGLVRRDRLGRLKNGGATSYWKTRATPTDVRRYFRTY